MNILTITIKDKKINIRKDYYELYNSVCSTPLEKTVETNLLPNEIYDFTVEKLMLKSINKEFEYNPSKVIAEWDNIISSRTLDNKFEQFKFDNNLISLRKDYLAISKTYNFPITTDYIEKMSAKYKMPLYDFAIEWDILKMCDLESWLSDTPVAFLKHWEEVKIC